MGRPASFQGRSWNSRSQREVLGRRRRTISVSPGRGERTGRAEPLGYQQGVTWDTLGIVGESETS